MNGLEKREEIDRMVNNLLEDVVQGVKEKTRKALLSGAVDLDNFNKDQAYFYPKAIVIASLQGEIDRLQHSANSIRKEAENLRAFI